MEIRGVRDIYHTYEESNRLAIDGLRHFKKALAPHAKHFEDIYLPIRHAIFAHHDQCGQQAFPTMVLNLS